MNKPISYSEKNLKLLSKIKENKKCFDCGNGCAQWVSVNNGVFLCLNCAGIHRGLGVHISSIKSLTLDKFDENHIKLLKISGNLRLSNLLKEYGIDSNMAIEKKYKLKLLDYYRKLLRSEAFGEEKPEKPAIKIGLESIEDNLKKNINIDNTNFINNANAKKYNNIGNTKIKNSDNV